MTALPAGASTSRFWVMEGLIDGWLSRDQEFPPESAKGKRKGSSSVVSGSQEKSKGGSALAGPRCPLPSLMSVVVQSCVQTVLEPINSVTLEKAIASCAEATKYPRGSSCLATTPSS